MKVAIRVDATSQIGAGHFMRCLTIADSLKLFSTQIFFISRNLPEYLQVMLIEKGHDFVIFNNRDGCAKHDELQHSGWLAVSQEQDALDTNLSLNGIAWDWLIVDHYALDFRWESKVSQVAKKILVIDDLADRKHRCDILLDQNLYSNMEARYADKVPNYCKLLLGPRYAMLRDEFINMRQYARPRIGMVKNILVFFGSVDSDNNTLSAMNALINVGCKKLHVDIVIGIQNSSQAQIKEICAKNNFILHIQSKKMAELIIKADLAIGAGGISTYERLYLRLPAMLKVITLNQLEPLLHMSKLGFFDLFSSQQELESKLRKKLNQENASPPDCVGDCNKNIVELMIEDFMKLLVPRPWDLKRTFKWLQNQKLRSDFFVSEAPQRKTHFAYWRETLNDQSQKVYSILYSGKHVGNCGLKKINAKDRTSEIWIYLADVTARRKGVAKCAVLNLLSIAKNNLNCTEVNLHVARNNLAAIKLYKNTGFYQAQEPLTGRWSHRDAEFILMKCAL